jgi:MFS family permease
MSLSAKKRTSLYFIFLLGLVSLFAEMAYEGSHSMSGQYLSRLSANSLIIGTLAGFGELIAFGIRGLTGYIIRHPHQWWPVTFVGYVINLSTVPLLALATRWEEAALLMLLERLGKAIRTAPRDAMLSSANQDIAQGWVSGTHKSMERLGAIIGPILATIALYRYDSYQMGFALLIIPGICSLLTLTYARKTYPHPDRLRAAQGLVVIQKIDAKYRLHLLATACIGAGYLDFSLIAYHFEQQNIMSSVWIPLLFASAMATAAISALINGFLYDKLGIFILIFIAVFSAFFAPLVFLGNFYVAFCGMLLWGMGYGAQEAILRAFMGELSQTMPGHTARMFGFQWYLFFGISWCLGSILMGALYDYSLMSLVVFSCLIQLTAIPLFILTTKRFT